MARGSQFLRLRMSAFEGKADSLTHLSECLLLARSGHSRCRRILSRNSARTRGPTHSKVGMRDRVDGPAGCMQSTVIRPSGASGYCSDPSAPSGASGYCSDPSAPSDALGFSPVRIPRHDVCGGLCCHVSRLVAGVSTLSPDHPPGA